MRPTLKKTNRKSAGFLTFTKSGEDIYEFYLENDFYTALETSLATIYTMFESDIPAWNENEKVEMENIVAKLNGMLSESGTV